MRLGRSTIPDIIETLEEQGRGQMPRSTEHYIHNRYLEIREEATALRAASDNAFWDRLFGKRDA
jgi:hypothetical protein